jgi:hypothetical protein
MKYATCPSDYTPTRGHASLLELCRWQVEPRRTQISYCSQYKLSSHFGSIPPREVPSGPSRWSAPFQQDSWHQEPDAAGLEPRTCAPATNIRHLGFGLEDSDSAYIISSIAIRWEPGKRGRIPTCDSSVKKAEVHSKTVRCNRWVHAYSALPVDSSRLRKHRR